MRIRSPHAAFTLVELLVVMAIIGILAALLLPAVQASRESARAAQCKNNLKQISLAAELFHDTYGAYPPARYQPRPGDPVEMSCGGSETTWLVRIMPFLEQAAREAGWDYSQPYADHSQDLREGTLSVYACPSRRSASNAVGEGLLATTTTTYIVVPCGCRIPITRPSSVVVRGAVGDYGGNHGDLSPGSFGLPTDFYFGGNGTGVIISSRARCENNLPQNWVDRVSHKNVTDGLSNTLLAGEMHVPLGKLGVSPEDAFIFNGDHVFNACRVGGPTVPIVSDKRAATGNGLVSWGSWHPGVCHFAMSDGSVRSFAATLDTEILGRLGHRADGEPIPHGP
ncbi:MAG: DUF1559 domain-containing protein [Pirellulaceae bacterium]